MPQFSSARRITSRSVARHSRGIRGPVLPEDLPARRSRAEKFDRLVLDAFARIDHRWHDKLSKLDIAVDDVPKIRALDPESVTWPPEVVAEGPVPLSRLVPAGIDKRGETTRARVVLFRRPLERRAKHPEDLEDLLFEVLVEQVATYLGIDPDEVDPASAEP
ncbi:metallopeptidase family protein [Rhodococcus fascians]|uniref:metallopeptidase family protein n=1 Tax=Rhodococcoides fascians TaxID=1828 RepID=UPI0024BA9641|nr:metallopeptidase family protein [Rhodococcus fascians]MDJ0424792.1 metallopeptidase family protein [Rhodococcus fascians]